MRVILLASLLTLASCAIATGPAAPVQRFGSVIGLRAEKMEEYKRLHAAVWPEVAKALRDAHIRNYSIYLRKLPDGNNYLFSYLEYVGSDHAGDMAKMAANPKVREWWTLTDPCQQPLPDRPAGQWWAPMEQVFYQP
jgi:L-rhamnose mutarotase